MSTEVETGHEFDTYLNTDGSVQIDIYQDPEDETDRDPDDVLVITLEDLARDLIENLSDDDGVFDPDHDQVIYNTIASMRDAIAILEDALTVEEDE